MPPAMIEAIMPILAIVSIGTMVLIGMKIKQGGHKSHLPEERVLDELRDEVGQLGDQVHMLRDELVDVNERMEFTERLLAQSERSKREKVDTPV